MRPHADFFSGKTSRVCTVETLGMPRIFAASVTQYVCKFQLCMEQLWAVKA